MPKSVHAIEEEDVERQVVNSAAEEEADEEEFEIERILAYEPNRFISEQTKKNLFVGEKSLSPRDKELPSRAYLLAGMNLRVISALRSFLERVQKVGGFYVKWKGYTSDDNSWVSVEDCHAEDLINDFWEQHPGQRPKPKGSKHAITPKGGKGKLPLSEGTSLKTKSRSRHEETMEIDSEGQPPKKKSRLTKVSNPVSSSSAGARTNGRPFSKLGRDDTESADEHGLPISSDNQGQKVQRLDLMNIPDLTAKIRSVETVEMHQGKLFYFLTLKDGTGGAVPSTYVRKKIPDITIDFFENNLRWKEETDRE